MPEAPKKNVPRVPMSDSQKRGLGERLLNGHKLLIEACQKAHETITALMEELCRYQDHDTNVCLAAEGARRLCIQALESTKGAS